MGPTNCGSAAKCAKRCAAGCSVPGAKEWAVKPGKFETYYDRREPWAKVPSHRYLAVRRGEAEEVLRVGIEIDDQAVIRH